MKKILLALGLLAFLVRPVSAQIPVTDAANLIPNTLSSISNYASQINTSLTQVNTYATQANTYLTQANTWQTYLRYGPLSEAMQNIQMAYASYNRLVSTIGNIRNNVSGAHAMGGGGTNISWTTPRSFLWGADPGTVGVSVTVGSNYRGVTGNGQYGYSAPSMAVAYGSDLGRVERDVLSYREQQERDQSAEAAQVAQEQAALASSMVNDQAGANSKTTEAHLATANNLALMSLTNQEEMAKISTARALREEADRRIKEETERAKLGVGVAAAVGAGDQ